MNSAIGKVVQAPAKPAAVSGALVKSAAAAFVVKAAAAAIALSSLLAPQAVHAQAFPCAPTATAGTVTVCAASSTTDRGGSFASGLQVGEGDSVGISVRAHGLTSGSLSVTLSLVGTNNNDVDVSSGLVFTLNSANPEQTKNFLIIDDAVKEPNELISFSITTDGNIVGTNANRTFTRGTPSVYSLSILPNDGRTITVTGPSTIAETDSNVESTDYTITRTGDAFSAATNVTWTITHGTTVASDFTATNGTVSFATGDSSKTFRISVAGDTITEGDETFSVQVSVANPYLDGGTNYGAVHSTTITDDDGYTLALAAPASPAQEGSTPMFTVTYTDSNGARARALGAEASITATVTNDVPDGHSFVNGLDTTQRACGQDWDNTLTPDCNAAGNTIATASCTIPANTTHNTAIDCTLPMVVDDTLSERTEHYRVALSGGPGGVQFTPSSVQHTIAASDPVHVTLGDTPAPVTESNSATLRINFSAAAGTTYQFNDFSISFTNPEDPGALVETPVIPFSSVASPGYYDWSISVSDDTIPEVHDMRDYVLRGSISPNFHYILPAEAASRTRTITFNDDDVVEFTVRPRGSGDNAADDVNEAAGQPASPTDTSFDAAGTVENAMYFRFDNYHGDPGLRGPGVSTVLTYCLGGTATGGTAAQVAANPAQYDYTWPAGYNPASTSEADAEYPGSCGTGRGQVTIPADHTQRQFRFGIALNNDDINEGDETITAELVAVSQAGYPDLAIVDNNVDDPNYGDSTTGQYLATRTIKDDDAISISIANRGTDSDGATTGFQVSEGRNAEFTVTLSKVAAGNVTVAYTISGDVGPDDYTGTTDGTITIAAGTTEGVVSIPLTDDADADTASEDLTVTLSATAADHSAPGTIMRSTTAAEQSATQKVVAFAAARTLQLTRVNSIGNEVTNPVDENDSESGLTLNYNIGFSGLSDAAFPVDTELLWEITHGDPSVTTRSETADNDFAAVTGSVTMSAGQNSAAFEVIVAGDNRNEDTEYFSVSIGAVDADASSGTRPSGGLTAAIRDDDQVTITLSGGRSFREDATEVDVMVDFGAELTLPFSMGFLILRDDDTHGRDGDSNNDNAELADYSTGGIWLPASGLPTIARSQIDSAFVASAGVTTAAFSVVGVDEDGDPHGFDQDDLNEADERFWVAVDSEVTISRTGSNVWGDVAFQTTLTAFTVEDVNPMTVAVAAAANTVTEGRTVRFDITLTGASAGSDGNFDVLYTLDGLAGIVTPTDSGNGRLQFRRAGGPTAIMGTVTATVPSTTERDSSDDSSMLTLTITGVEKQPTSPTVNPVIDPPPAFGYNPGEQQDHAAGVINIASAPDDRASVAVEWVDAAHEFTLSGTDDTIAEPAVAQATSGTYTITRTGPNLASALEIVWSIDHTGTEDADFEATTGAVSFSGGDTSKEFRIFAAVDSLNEATEDFTIRFEVDSAADAAVGGVGLPDPHGVRITDNADDAIVVNITGGDSDAPNRNEGGANNSTATFTVTLSGGVRTSTVTVPFSLSGDGITDSDFDIVTPTGIAASAFGGEVVFGIDGAQAADDSAPVQVQLLEDDLNEASEPLTLTGVGAGPDGLRHAGGGAIRYGTNAATLTIADNDAIAVRIEVTGDDADADAAGHQAPEGSRARFRFTMDHASAAEAIIPYRIGGDVEPADYDGTTEGLVTIPAGETSAVLAIRLLLDADTDTTETMTVTLGVFGVAAAGVIARSATAAEQSATVEITEFTSVRTLQVARVDSVAEGDDTVNARYEVSLGSGDTAFGGAAQLRWYVTNEGGPSTGSVTADNDFDALEGTFAINPGATANFDVPIAGDNRNEDTEYFTVFVEAVNPTADSGTRPSSGVETAIVDDDQVVITLSGGRSFREDTTETVDVVVDFGAELTRAFRLDMRVLRDSNPENPDGDPDTNAAELGLDFNTGTGYSPLAGLPTIARSQLTGFVAPAGATTFSAPISDRNVTTVGPGFEDDDLNEAAEMFWIVPDLNDNGTRDINNPVDDRCCIKGDGAWGQAVFLGSPERYTVLDVNPITATVVAAAAAVTEGRSVRFDVTLTGASGGADGNFDLLYTLGGVAGANLVDPGEGRLRFNRRGGSSDRGTPVTGEATVFIRFTDTLGGGDEDSTLTFRITGVEEQPTQPFVNGPGEPSGNPNPGETRDYAIGEINIADAPNDRASVTVAWTDATPDHVFTLSTAPATVAEPAAAMGAPATFEVRRTGPDLATTVGITWNIRHGGAVAKDFDGATSGEVMFFGNTTMHTVVVHAAVDNLNEGDEDFTIVFGLADTTAAANEGGAAPPATHSARITDNADDAIEVRISRDSATPERITESSTATATFNIVLSGGLRTGDVTAPFSFSGMGITADDFNITAPSGIGAGAVRGEVVFSGPAASPTTRSVTITLQDDTRQESDETLTLTGAAAGPAGLRTASGGAIRYAAGASTATVVIVDDGDTGPSFDTQAPRFRDDHLGWAAGQRVLWLTTDEAYKVLAYPSGARAASGAPSLTTLDAGGFRVIENMGLASAATLSVTSVRVIPPSQAFALTLERAIGADATNLYVSYSRVSGNAIYDTAVEDGDADPAVGRNALLSQGPFSLPQSGNTDTDGDGMPDTVEIAIGENPLETVAQERMPAFSLSRTATPNPVAYSGIREHGVQAHLGYAVTGAATVTAYYRSNNFGYDGTYQCASGPFPANYAAPLAEGGCAAVDWGDIVPGERHTIAWLARSADGVWFVRDGGSRLPEQTIERIPELNMDAQHLFTTGDVVIRASLDAAPGETPLTLTLRRTPSGGGAGASFTSNGGQTFEVMRTSAETALWEIRDLANAGNEALLYRPTTPTAGFTANHPSADEYSLGLVRRTQVTRINAPVPPILGRAWLAFSTAPIDATHLLRDGAAQNLYVVVENNDDIGSGTSVMLTHNGVLSSATPGSFRSSLSAYPVTLALDAGVSSVTDTAVLQVTVTGGFGGVTTATYRFPVRPADSPLAQTAVVGADSDADGIIDDIDDFDDSDHLPVVVDEEAGASAWHHIRPALPVHDLHLGEMTVQRLSSATMNDQVDDYGEYSASSVPEDSGLAVVYDFEIAGVDYSEVTAEGRTGGAAGVIIPLPRSLYDSGASLVKYPSNEAFSVEGGNDYGFAMLQEDGACPDDTMEAGSPYRDGETLRRAKRGGDACLAVYIVDGGANDEDGVANGVIKDPLGIRAGNAAIGGGARSSSGALGPLALAALLLILALSLVQVRRRRC